MGEVYRRFYGVAIDGTRQGLAWSSSSARRSPPGLLAGLFLSVMRLTSPKSEYRVPSRVRRREGAAVRARIARMRAVNRHWNGGTT